jgi:hypothetical protein
MQSEIIQDLDDSIDDYEIPRPWLTLQEAASIMGRSQRALERSIIGRWGNKLPAGWSARHVTIDGQAEWRIIPPPGFRIKRTHKSTNEINTEDASVTQPKEQKDQNFSLEKLFNTIGTSIGTSVKNQLQTASGSIDAEITPATIVIDRSDEVEKLLRELSDTRQELAEQRKMHMDDLRLLHEMQTSMRLLEVNAIETSTLKKELIEAQQMLIEHKQRYERFASLPWYKKLFSKHP